MVRIDKHYICDRCGAEMNWRSHCDNGMTEKMRFRVQVKVTEYIPGSFSRRCYQTVVMCPACWKEFEKVYREFMEK